MALFLNAQGRAEFPVQILCFLMNRRVFQTFDVGCAGEKGLQYLSGGFQLTGHTVKKSQAVIGIWDILDLDRLLEKDLSFLKFLLLHHQARIDVADIIEGVQEKARRIPKTIQQWTKGG